MRKLQFALIVILLLLPVRVFTSEEFTSEAFAQIVEIQTNIPCSGPL